MMMRARTDAVDHEHRAGYPAIIMYGAGKKALGSAGSTDIKPAANLLQDSNGAY
jgi:hypothetical protein